MSVVFPEGNYIFCWGGLIMNAGGMTRAMLKRACTLIRAGRDVTILCAARSMEQLNGVEHYQQNGYPEISRKNFVIREAWEGERLSDNRTHHEVGILARSDTLCVELTNKGKVYWQDGVELAREIPSQTPGKREIRYTSPAGESVAEVYWEDSLSRIITDYVDDKGTKHRRERYFAPNGFCHTAFESVWTNNTWNITSIRSFDETAHTVEEFKDYSPFRQRFFSSYVNECAAGQIFVFCDPILDFEPGFSKMHERDGKTIYKIGVNHGVGFGGERNWNSVINPRIRDNIEKVVASTMDALVLLTKQANEDFRKRLGGRDVLFTVPNTVRIPKEIRPFSTRDLNRAVYIGRFDENPKQISHLIRAFAIVCKRHPDAHLHIFGRGASEAEYRRLIQELDLGRWVILEPFTNDVEGEYQKAAFSVSCSLWEGFNLSMGESLANGCPVVSYDYKYGPREQIENGKNGLLVKLNDIEMLADKICWMLAHPKKVEEMSENARVMVDQYHERFYNSNWADVLNALVLQHPYRTHLTDMQVQLSQKTYTPILNKFTFSGVLTVLGSVPKAAEGMERIYLRLYNHDDSDYSIIDCSSKAADGETHSFNISGKLSAERKKRVTICLEWNNCFIERDMALWD